MSVVVATTAPEPLLAFLYLNTSKRPFLAQFLYLLYLIVWVHKCSKCIHTEKYAKMQRVQCIWCELVQNITQHQESVRVFQQFFRPARCSFLWKKKVCVFLKNLHQVFVGAQKVTWWQICNSMITYAPLNSWYYYIKQVHLSIHTFLLESPALIQPKII